MERLIQLITKIGSIVINKESIFFNNMFEFDKKSIDSKYCIFINMILIYSCIIPIIYFYNFKTSINYVLNNFLNSFRLNPMLIDYPQYSQILDIVYINDSFSFNLYAFIYWKLLLIIFLSILYLKFYEPMNEFYNQNPMPYILIWSGIGLSIMTYYLFATFGRTGYISNKNKLVEKLIYEHINQDYLDKFICNYNNKNNLDDNFINGYCNDLSFSNSDLITYFKNILGKMQSSYEINIADITIKDFKSYIDDNDKKYYDILINTLFTHTLVNYFVKNNLTDQAFEFFSIDNLTYTQNEKLFDKIKNIFNDKVSSNISIFNFITNNDLSVMESNYSYNDNFKAIIPKKLFYNLIQDYNIIQDDVSNTIIDILNNCNNKIPPPENYYYSITIVLVIMLIYYIYYIYYNP